MSKNKYNIEEVFKSELEDFEMDIPQNGWANISNNIANASKVAKTSIWGSSAFSFTAIGTSLVIATGAILYSNSTINKETSISSEKNTQTSLLNQTTEDIDNSITFADDKQISTEVVIDPVIEETKKEKRKTSKQYIIKNTSSANESNSTNQNNSLNNTPTIFTKKPIKELAVANEQIENDIEIIEIEATEIVASISASPVGGPAPLTVDFSHQNENTSSKWNFNDGNRSNENKLSHTFEKEGQYEVELTITDENGNTASATKTINVLATSKIYKIPNIFTPNNDGINDVFIVNHENIEVFDLYIYDKSGALIFESNDLEKGWNGNTQFSEKAEAGNYIYMIKAKGTDGKNFEESGIVKLAR